MIAMKMPKKMSATPVHMMARGRDPGLRKAATIPERFFTDSPHIRQTTYPQARVAAAASFAVSPKSSCDGQEHRGLPLARPHPIAATPRSVRHDSQEQNT